MHEPFGWRIPAEGFGQQQPESDPSTVRTETAATERNVVEPFASDQTIESIARTVLDLQSRGQSLIGSDGRQYSAAELVGTIDRALSALNAEFLAARCQTPREIDAFLAANGVTRAGGLRASLVDAVIVSIMSLARHFKAGENVNRHPYTHLPETPFEAQYRNLESRWPNPKQQL